MPKTFTFEEVTGQIPTGGEPPAPPAAPEETGFGRVMRKAGEAAEAVGPIGLGAAGALKLAGRAPAAVRAAAGPIERGARTLSEALTPTSLRQLGGMIGSAGLAGGAGEIARQQAQSSGAGPIGQKMAETVGALAPSGARVAVQRAAAPIVEKVGQRLYTPPADLATPEKAKMREALTAADIRLLPSEIRESRPLKALERMFQLIPGSRDEFSKFGRQNQQAVNLAVAKAFGGVEPSLAPRVMQEADRNLGQSYKELLDDKTFKVSDQISERLQRAFAQNEQLREFAVGNPKVSQLASSLAAGDALNGGLWKEVRSEIARFVSKLEGASNVTGKQVLEQFDNIAKSNLSKADHDALMGIDRKYAALQVFKDAFRRDPSIVRAGDVELNKFAKQYAFVEPMNVLYGKTAGRGGEYVPLVEAAQTYRVATQPKVPETQAATLAGLGRVATGLGLYGGGFAALPTYPALGAAALTAPTVSKELSKAYLRPAETAEALRGATLSPFAAIPMFTGGQ